MRILRDPAATDGAATAAPTETETKAAETKAAETKAAAKPARIEVDPADLSGLYQRLTAAEAALKQRDAAEREAIDKANQERLRALSEKEGVEKALAEQERQWKERYESEAKARRDLESSFLAEKKAIVIADALAGVEFTTEHAARDARRKLEERFGVERDSGGKVVVRDLASGRFAADSIPDLIRGDEFAHFLKPTTRGGSGSATRPGHEAADPEVHDDQAAMLARVKAHLEASRANTIGL